MAAATSVGSMLNMQRKSRGHSRRKHGAHSTRLRITRQNGPRGAVSSGEVEPKMATTGTPRSAARCMVPVSLVRRR